MSYVFLNMWVSRQWQNSHFCLNYPFNYKDRNRCLPILEAVIHNATLLKCVISSHPLQIPPTLTSCLSDFNNCYCSISVLFSLLLFWKHCACLASIIACQIPHYLKSCNMSFMEVPCGTHAPLCHPLSSFCFCASIYLRLSGLMQFAYKMGEWISLIQFFRNRLNIRANEQVEFKSNMLAVTFFQQFTAVIQRADCFIHDVKIKTFINSKCNHKNTRRSQ